MLKYLSTVEFKREALAGRGAGLGIVLPSSSLRAVDEARRAATFIFSQGTVDRQNDKIDPAGWQLNDFRRNPVALYGHNSAGLPIGRAENVRVEGGRLIGEIRFAPAETFDFADRVFRMVRDGYLTACSVGFVPLEYTFATGRPGGIDFKRQALLEISVVTIPAHQSALLVGAGADPAKLRQRQLDLLRLRHGPL